VITQLCPGARSDAVRTVVTEPQGQARKHLLLRAGLPEEIDGHGERHDLQPIQRAGEDVARSTWCPKKPGTSKMVARGLQ
jgi:hypothetical protein